MLDDYIVDCSKISSTGAMLPFTRQQVKISKLIFEKDRRVHLEMKKIIALSTLLALGALGMACGDGGANNAANTANKTVANALNQANAATANAVNQIQTAANQVSNAASQVNAAASNVNKATAPANSNANSNAKP